MTQERIAQPVGIVKAVLPHSAAAELGVQPNDELLAVNGHLCEDVIDVQYYAAEEWLELRIRRQGRELTLSGERRYDQPLGIEFMHPTFDIDIRRCNNLCEFCFVLQMAPRMRRTLYIKDDDYRYSFLFGHFVTLTNLRERDWQRIIEQHLSPLYVSVHATDLELRRRCLRNPQAPDIMAQLRELAEHNFEVHTQLVITPNLNDGEHMARSVRDLASLYPTVRSVSVVPVGLTKYHRYGLITNSLDHANAVLDACEAWQREFRARFGVGFVYPTDEWYLITGRPLPPLAEYDGLALHENGLGMVRSFLDEWAQVRRREVPQLRAEQLRAKQLTLVTATLFAPILQAAAAELAAESALEVRVQPIVNTRLGETITVAGLLTAEDVIAQLLPLKAAGALGDLVILPRIMFDHPEGIALDDRSPLDVARALEVPVALADCMGDVLDAAQGANKLTFSPHLAPAEIPIVRQGGWAVEKYL
ncbi:MAG: DUF512 domain-containing protein [Candidatus Thermofonsia Clade 1 bacterium]|jgi:putative radical SAM enzyme (TIGR03279 family)|uniref:DUF512 domain-containing protein n=1 Tax=Candidatus Thermofonsia Clade 1 bacterium TaxID=2364210 RepID=A0A2M8PYD5_9CHLR|nr:MAG: DUF512 domain-containing protein [Candidatus Thermofonsia Clade 1 bacterium]PJF42542.1 MAG: DUF512 domain-containing protein [Candidatus Thermofonsia Clade 1 bacterium]RMF53227.1 MAG: DUF512 domain-containing protein [Chloroflexota bacterium]